MATALVCAYSAVGTEALRGLLEAGVQVLGLYTYPQPPADRWFEAPETLALRQGIPVHHAQDIRDEAVCEAIRQADPDFLFSFYFREMIPARILEVPRQGAYNLHGSLLPAYRGRAPINWVLVHGERRTGISLHAMTPRPDDGDLIAQTELPIDWDETALSLTWKAAHAGRALIREAVPRLLDGSARPTPQRDLGPSTYFGGRRPEDSRLDFAMTPHEAFNQIRAVADPWPNAFLATAAGPLKVAWALPSPAPCPSGAFRITPEGVLLGFREGALRLVALRRGDSRSERPTEHAAWLRDAGLPEAP